MAKLIRDRKLVVDSWQKLESADTLAQVAGDADFIVPLAVWKSHRDALTARAGRVGVLLQPADDPAAVAKDFADLALIAVQFPKFTDGRGYSTARLLRSRYGWRGEMRAVGDVQRDQLFYLSRCGFDSYEMADTADVESAVSAFKDFTEAYQTSVDQPQPLFRRRNGEELTGASLAGQA